MIRNAIPRHFLKRTEDGIKACFFVDDIIYQEASPEIFIARIVPDIESDYFPPWLLRNVRFLKHLLSGDYYNSLLSKYNELQEDSTRFTGAVVQGQYYEVSEKDLPEGFFSGRNLMDEGISNILLAAKKVTPYPESTYYNNRQTLDIGELSSRKRDIFPAIYLYCLNVGQGDSFLLICPNGNVYLIDTNYNASKKDYVGEIVAILKKYKLENKIKAFIVTHKHLDHIRGAADVFRKLHVEYFLINYDYKHETKPVNTLLSAASSIKKWINVNRESVFNEGNVKFSIKNPDSRTSSKLKTPDINDSSIILCVEVQRFLEEMLI